MPDTVTSGTVSTSEPDAEAAAVGGAIVAAVTAGEAKSDAEQAQTKADESGLRAEQAEAVAAVGVEAAADANARAGAAEIRAMSAEERLTRLESYLVERDRPPPEPAARPVPAQVKTPDQPPKAMTKAKRKGWLSSLGESWDKGRG
jgi:hypothetical protein